MSNQMRHEGAVLRRAARFFERNRRGMTSHYPCFAVRHCNKDFISGSYADLHTLPGRFIGSACPGRKAPWSGFDASDRFLDEINLDKPEGRAHTVLALLFAAAMAETGDL